MSNQALLVAVLGLLAVGLVVKKKDVGKWAVGKLEVV